MRRSATSASPPDGYPLHLAALWRYPVKSLQGEQLETAVIDAGGVQGDRSWGLRDAVSGRLLSARRHPALLLASASFAGDDDDRPVITLPDGTVLAGPGPATDRDLTAWLGRPVRLVASAVEPSRPGEYYGEAAPARFVDAFPLLVVTTSSVAAGAAGHPAGAWDIRRFRPNLVIDTGAGGGWIEDDWIGRPVEVGPVGLVPRERCERCPMVVRPQPGLERDSAVLKSLVQTHGGTLGVWTAVTRDGIATVGDPVTVG